MQSLAELRRCAAAIELRFAGMHLDRTVQPDRESVVLCFRGSPPGGGPTEKRFLSLSCHRELGRVCEVAKAPPAPATPPALPSYLRAHASKAPLLGARVRGNDRQLQLDFDGPGGLVTLLLSLMGGRSNVYALDAQEVLRASLRPVEQSRRDLALGKLWADPEARDFGEGDDRFAEVPDAELLVAVEAAYSDRASASRASKLAAALLRALRKERKGGQRRLERVEAELAEADKASELQRQGDLLKTVLGRVEAGASQIAVEDPANGETVKIPLDPALSPQANLQATFKRYQKFVRRLTKAGGQAQEARGRVEQLDAWIDSAARLAESDSSTPAEVDALLENVELRRLLKKYESVVPEVKSEPKRPRLPKRLQGVPTRFMPRRYRSSDGLEIWVGRSDAANDHLTTRLARGNDLFFHLDGAPGSHVILCTEGKSEVPPESILDACALAVRFSKQKNASRADVHVVPIKQVKKPKGAKPGLVWVTGGKTVHLRVEEGRLERLFASKIDE